MHPVVADFAIVEPVRLELLRLAGASPDREVGALLGAPAGTRTVTEARPIRNRAATPATAFALSRWAVARAVVGLAQRGQVLVGLFHSHLVGPPVPSPQDQALYAHYPGLVLVLTSLARHPPALVAWTRGPAGAEPLLAYEVRMEPTCRSC